MELHKKEELITKEFLFSKIDSFDVYRYYIGDFVIGQARKSPFRKDNNPSFSIYMKDGKLRHTDFADDRYRGDCIDLVQQLFNLDTKKATQKIAKDFGISEGTDESERITSQYSKPFMDQKRHSFIQVSTRAWTSDDAAYWKQFGITKDQLKAEEVYPIKDLFINRRKQFINKDELVYVYRYAEGFKIYFPNRPKGERWKSNIQLTLVENLKILDEYDPSVVLITKSKKDRLVLSRYFPYVLNVQNETRACFTEQFVEKLKGRIVWINYDSDDTGVKNCIRITTEFGYRYINVPKVYLEEGIKDYADLYRLHGEEAVINSLKEKGLI